MLQDGRLEAIPAEPKPTYRYVAAHPFKIETRRYKTGEEVARGDGPEKIRKARLNHYAHLESDNPTVGAGHIEAGLIHGRLVAERLD